MTLPSAWPFTFDLLGGGEVEGWPQAVLRVSLCVLIGWLTLTEFIKNELQLIRHCVDGSEDKDARGQRGANDL